MEDGVKCRCRHCTTELPPDHTGPCPVCGKTGKDCVAVANATIDIRVGSAVRLKRRGVKRFVLDMVSRWKPSGDPTLPSGVHEERIVDKKHNRYDQVVTDASTGRVVHAEHEALSEHKHEPRIDEA